MNFYDIYHKQNTRIQAKIVRRNNYTYHTILVLVDNLFSKVDSKKILDVGCGVGTIGLYLANSGHEVRGIDLSKRAIDLANKSKRELCLSNISFTQGDVVNKRLYKKAYYDYAICSEVIEHVKNESLLLQNIRGALKTSGILILSTPSLNAPLYRWGKLREFDERVGHLRRYTPKSIQELLSKNGFLVTKILKTEGLMRNFLFTNNKWGWIIRFLKWPITIPANFIDGLLLKFFGESDIYVIAKKK